MRTGPVERLGEEHTLQPSRRSRLRLRRGLVAAVALTLPVLSGCASGFDSPVLQDYNPSVGVNVRTGDVWAMNLLVVLPESGQGTLVGALLNQTPTADRLVGATVESEPDEQPIRSSMVRSSVPLAPERLVELSEPTTVAVEGNVTPGRFVTVTLQFQRAEPIEVKIPVVAPTGAYAEVPLPSALGPSPSPTQSPIQSPTPS